MVSKSNDHIPESEPEELEEPIIARPIEENYYPKREARNEVKATESEIKAENKKKPFDLKAYEKFKDTVQDFNIDLLAYDEITDTDLNAYLAFLRKSKSLFKEALTEGLYRNELMMWLTDIMRPKLRQHDQYITVSSIDKQIVETILPIVEELQPVIEKSRKESPNSFNDEAMFDLYNEFVKAAKDGSPERHKGAEFLASHMKELEEGLNGDKWDSYTTFIGSIINYGTKPRKREAIEVMAGAILSSNASYQFRFLLSELSRFKEAENEVKDITCAELIKFGLPPFEVFDNWTKSADPKNFDLVLQRNLGRLREIEKIESGASQFLYKEFGICDFGRYPLEVLVDMVRNYNNKEKPYGLVIFPRDDHNGAFYGGLDSFKNLYGQLNGEFLLRIVECENKTDIARSLLKLDKLYSSDDDSGQKISLLILGGHGEKNSIEFGGKDKKHKLHIDDLAGSGVRKTNKFFIENPTFILNSCSTGVQKGIGQELSEIFKAKVIAPKIPVPLPKLKAIKNENGNFEFDAEFIGQDSKMLYQMGNMEDKK